MKIGDRVKIARQQNGLSQSQLANKLGVTQTTISNWEVGRITPAKVWISKLEAVLGPGLSKRSMDTTIGGSSTVASWLSRAREQTGLTPAELAKKAGLSKQGTSFLMGHDAFEGGAMRDWYDSPQLQDIFDEQAARLPYGPLGFLELSTVELEGGLSKEVVSLVSAYLAGQTGTMEFATQMEKVKMQRWAQEAPAMEI